MITVLDKIKQNALLYPNLLFMRTLTEYGEMQLDWKDLDLFSDKLASYMKYSLLTKKPVIVYGHKNPLTIVCFLACVKSGRAYCPIDVNVPLSRTEAIIDEVRPELILTTENLDIQNEMIKSLDQIMDIISKTECNIENTDYVKSDDVFYIIFTSGSTGIPKGVQITRECLDSFINWAITLGNGFNDDRRRVFINQAPFSFDLSVMDLYLCLYTGGTLFSLSKSIQQDMKLLYGALKESNADAWISTPSLWMCACRIRCFLKTLCQV